MSPRTGGYKPKVHLHLDGKPERWTVCGLFRGINYGVTADVEDVTCEHCKAGGHVTKDGSRGRA